MQVSTKSATLLHKINILLNKGQVQSISLSDFSYCPYFSNMTAICSTFDSLCSSQIPQINHKINSKEDANTLLKVSISSSFTKGQTVQKRNFFSNYKIIDFFSLKKKEIKIWSSDSVNWKFLNKFLVVTVCLLIFPLDYFWNFQLHLLKGWKSIFSE